MSSFGKAQGDNIGKDEGQASAAHTTALDTNSSSQPRGGLYSRWEGLQPSDGVQSREASASDIENLHSKPNPELVESRNSTSTSSAHQDDHTPAAGAKPYSNRAGNRAIHEDTMRAHAEPARYGQAYSDRNPAPNIRTHREEEQQRQEASRRYFESGRGDADNSSGNVQTESTGHEAPTSGDDARAGATDDVPIGGEKSNILFQPTPNVDTGRIFQTLKKDSLRVSYLICVVIMLLDWLFIGGGFKGLLKSLIPAIGVAVTVYLIITIVGRKAAEWGIHQSETATEKLRYVPESVEWLNSLVETLWQTLQQDFFDNIASQIDDTIKPYIPKGVPATVKITDLSHGCHAARLLSMRSLPDHEFGDLVPTHGIDKSGSVEQARQREKAIEAEEGGVFYNLEIAIAYHAAPSRPRKDHMHVDILAVVGPVPIPIFVEVKEFMATIRLRLQMHPDLPFLKNLTFALTEPPKINACVSIGAPWALDLLNLPVIDSILDSQINSAAAAFIQPKSMTLDMTAYVGGSDQKEDTEAIGVLFVKIHRARNLARQDSRGPGADPYLTIAFSKYEKPMYATRIIKGDRNPVWEESAIIMIRAEHVKRQENILLRLWDSDKTGSDDVSGVCEFPLQELVLKANQMQKREDKLQGDFADTDAEGVLEWEVGYFPRADYEAALRTDAMNPRDHHGDTKEVSEEDKKQTAQNTVPDPNLPSGILGLTIHQCINVEVDNPNKKSMGHVKVQHQDSDGEDNEEPETISIDYIPSLYVQADINDELVYRTRVKRITNMPTFNSSTETYVRDWRLATLTLSVWDTRKKSDDCLVGVASIKLSDIFHESSSVVKFYDLKGGEGSGRIRISTIFRSMRMKVEDSLLGYSVGSFVFTSPVVCIGDMYTSKLKLRTSGSKRSIKSGGHKSNQGYTWTLDKQENSLPVHFRYMSPIVFEFVGGGLTEKISGPLGKNKHFAVLWLYQLVDNKVNDFTLPIYKTNNPERFTQNVVTQSDPSMQLERVGEIKFSAKYKAGIDETHGDFLDNHDQWTTYQAWMAARKSGQRDDQANRSINEFNAKLAKGIEQSQAIPV